MSDFEIPGKPKDYYLELKESDGTLRYLADRKTIRIYAQELQSYQYNLAKSGGDIYTSSLDESDRFHEFIRSEPLDAQAEIYTILAQETNAIANKINDQTVAIIGQEAKKEAEANYIGQIIGGIVLFFILMAFILNT